MILKRRKKPIELRKLEAIIPRLRTSFPKLDKIKHDAARRARGYIGERRVDYHLEQLANNFTILHDVSLNVFNQDFQIDHVLISNYAIYIVETKNFSGTITFDTILKQFTRNDGKVEKGYRYPITQAETIQLKLSNWISERNMDHIPIYYFIAISDPSTIINVIGDVEEIARVVAHGEYIPIKIMRLDEQMRQAAQNNGRKLLNQRQIGVRILKECKELEYDILKEYNVSHRDILPGVICPKCDWRGMDRGYGTWICGKCNFQSKRAHVRTLNDFFFLIKPSITNRECRDFLGISSRFTAKKILSNMDLQYQQHKGKSWVPKNNNN